MLTPCRAVRRATPTSNASTLTIKDEELEEQHFPPPRVGSYQVLASPRAGPSTHLRWVEDNGTDDEDEQSDCKLEDGYNVGEARSESHTIRGDTTPEMRLSPLPSDDGGEFRRSTEYMPGPSTRNSSEETTSGQSLQLPQSVFTGPNPVLPANLGPVVITETRLGPNTIRLQAAEPPEVFQQAMANLLANPTFTYIDPAGPEPPKRARGDKGNTSGRKRSSKGKSRRKRREDKFIRRKIRECKAEEERKQKDDQERMEGQFEDE